MFGSLVLLLFSSAAITGALPSGSASDDASLHALAKRGIFGPISTGSAAGLAGGQVACDAPPVSSFFAGMKPPVCKIWHLFRARYVG
jgi:endo-1,3(4)-beta-glucanase